MAALLRTAGAEPGDVVLIVAGPVKKAVQSILGALRLEVADRLQIPREGYNLLWITGDPLLRVE